MSRLFKTANSRVSIQNVVFTHLIARAFRKKFDDTRDILRVRGQFSSLPYPSVEFIKARHPDIDIGPDKADGVPVEWVSFADPLPHFVIMYLHGGGYMMGSIHTHRVINVRLARRCRAITLSVDYRLAPESPFPAGLDDALTVYRWLMRKYPPERIVIAGDSAGGGLTLALLLKIRESKLPMPCGALCFSAWTDLAVSGLSLSENAKKDRLLGDSPIRHWAETYLAGTDPKNPFASPLYGELYGLPPILMQASTIEVLRDDTTRFAEKATRSGVSVDMRLWKGTQHVWQMFPGSVPEVNQAFEHVSHFLQQLQARKDLKSAT